MRHFKILTILSVLAILAVSSFAAVGKVFPAAKASGASPAFVGFDRPFHLAFNDTGLTIGTNDTALFIGAGRTTLKTSDFNANMSGTNSTVSSPYGGWVDFRKDSIACTVSMQRVDADTSDVAWAAQVLDHGTTYFTAGSGSIPTNVALTRTRIVFPNTLSNQYWIRFTMTSATDTARVFRVACGDK